MPRPARASAGGICYHVINRGNGRAKVFHKDADYQAFLQSLAQACEHVAMPVLAYCLMPNHFHLVVLPHEDGDLGRWMHRVLTTHVRRFHRHRGSSGHVWQGRYKAFPIAADEHLLAVLRYVERNPVRANLVDRAEEWPWSSVRHGDAGSDRPPFLVAGPVERPAGWRSWVNRAQSPAELDALRRSVNRGSPYGGGDWSAATAARLGLQSTLRPRGRPKKASAAGKDGATGGQ